MQIAQCTRQIDNIYLFNEHKPQQVHNMFNYFASTTQQSDSVIDILTQIKHANAFESSRIIIFSYHFISIVVVSKNKQ